MQQKALQGEIQSWNEVRGFGFISPDVGGKPVFAHINDFKGIKRIPDVGERVTYRIAADKQNRPCAKQVVFECIKNSPSKIKLKTTLIVFALLFLCLVGLSVSLGALPVIVLLIYMALSLVTFLIYWRDKSAAKQNKWRTKEDTLHLLALFGGWPGAIIGQQLIRHKSKKLSFQVIFWLVVVINTFIFAWLLTDEGVSFLDSTIQHFYYYFID